MVKKQSCHMWIQTLHMHYIHCIHKNRWYLYKYIFIFTILTIFISMKDKLGGKIMTKFVRLRVKTYSYLIDDGSED